MTLIRIEEFAWRYRRLLVLLIVVGIIQFFELALLHYKYDIFTGGFLQPFSYQTFYDRIVFFFISLWFDGVFFGLIAVTWFFLSKKLTKHGVVNFYNFTFSVLFIMGCWLGYKFKVLSYFNDTINFQILKNISGGSFRSALLYANTEISIFIGIVLATMVMLFLGSKITSQFSYDGSFEPKEEKRARLFPFFILCLFVTPGIVYFINSHEFLKYGVGKKTSYRVINDVLDFATDFDSDGYGFFSIPPDKDAFDDSLYPGALDIPGNGIDEDGFLGDAIAPKVKQDRFSEISPRKGKHIVLIVLETARSDLLTKQMNGQYVAPVLRGLAEQGSLIKNAYSHSGYTVSSLNAIFNRNLIGQKTNNLLGFLHKSGYTASIISGQDESFGDVSTTTGMKADGVYFFDARVAIDDRVYVSKDSGSLRLSEERVVEQFKARVSEMDFSQPQFVYLNFQAAHFPYTHPKMVKRVTQNLIPRSEINIANKDWVKETYWNAIASADWAVGEVVNQLKKKNVFDNTTLVILGDHGESLFDQGFLGHGYALDDTQTSIPLIINDREIIVEEPIGQVDVAEITVRSALGIKNHWVNKNKAVFQYVGSLNKPALIAQVIKQGQRTLFDFNTEQVYFSEEKKWMDYKQALKNHQYKERVERLIREWESLRWRAYQVRKQQGS